jgi:uncharacterized membrane protein
MSIETPKRRKLWLPVVSFALGLLALLGGMAQMKSGRIAHYKQTNQPIFWYQGVAVGCVLLGFASWMLARSIKEGMKKPNHPPEPAAPSGRGSS